MPLPRRPTRQTPRTNNVSTPTATAVALGAPSVMNSVWNDYAADNEEEIAAHFPELSAEVAERLVDLLLPRNLTQPKGEDAA